MASILPWVRAQDPGRHLRAAEVRPTLELFLTVEETPLERREDEATGLPLLVP